MRDTIPDPPDMASVSQNMLDEAIKKHAMFLRGENGGGRCVFQYRNLSHLDFRHADFSQADFAGCLMMDANLTGGKFSSTNFFGCDMRNSDFSDANLTRADLRGAYMAGANLTRAILKDADMREGKIMKRDQKGILTDRRRSGGTGSHTVLTGAKLSDTNMSGVQAIAADFTDADLSGVTMTNANFRGVSFEGANLADSDMTGADLTMASMRGSIIAGTIMDNTEKQGIDIRGVISERDMGSNLKTLEKSLPELLEEHTLWVSTAGRRGCHLDLSGYDLRGVKDLRTFPLTAIRAVSANFLNQDLRHAEMQSAIFDRSDFRDCDLSNADLRGSSFKYAQMARANLSGVILCGLQFNNSDGSKRIQRADLSGANFRYGNFTGADLRDCNLTGVDFSHAVLRGCDLRRTDLNGAIFRGAILDDAKFDEGLADSILM